MSVKKKPLVVVTRKLPDSIETRMRELFDARLNLDDTPMTPEQIADAVRTADVLVPTVTDEPKVLTEDTADMTMALILAVPRRLIEGASILTEGKNWPGWSPTWMLGHRIGGKRLGIIGMGRIGAAAETDPQGRLYRQHRARRGDRRGNADQADRSRRDRRRRPRRVRERARGQSETGAAGQGRQGDAAAAYGLGDHRRPRRDGREGDHQHQNLPRQSQAAGPRAAQHVVRGCRLKRPHP